jgi:hypothetical protein
MSDELLDALSRDPAPRPGRRVGRRLSLAIAAGAAASLVGVLLLLGPRPQMAVAAAAPIFWMKLAYPLAVAIVATACIERLSRPVGDSRRRAVWLGGPLAIMALAAVAQWTVAPEAARMRLLMGGSAMICPWLIAVCATPVFAALVWALRGLAPTRLRAAGAMSGLLAGAVGAGLYALHCDESGGAFVLIWYTLGMIVPAAVGALSGPRLLRWR